MAMTAGHPASPRPPEGQDWLGVRVCKVHPLGTSWLVVSRGSVVDFTGHAIVNAANKGCIGGGGVDRAIKNAGGPRLQEAREALPVVPGSRSTRCPTGEARMTIGGDLPCRYCIHAVGPDYPVLMQRRGRKALPECDALVTSAYRASLGCAAQQGLRSVGFSLLSAGIFRGVQSLENVLLASLRGLEEGLYPELQEVHLIAFTPPELTALVQVCNAWTASPPGRPLAAGGAAAAAAATSALAMALGGQSDDQGGGPVLQLADLEASDEEGNDHPPSGEPVDEAGGEAAGIGPALA